jgi:hypothetical protein
MPRGCGESGRVNLKLATIKIDKEAAQNYDIP